MRENVPQNCGNERPAVRSLSLIDEEKAFFDTAEIADQVINEAVERYGTVGRAVARVAGTYKIKPAWLQRLRERRKVPIYLTYYNNLLVALEDAVVRQEAAIALNKARLGAISNAAGADRLSVDLERRGAAMAAAPASSR